MVINAIRFRTNEKDEPFVWRLNSGIGKYHNFSCVVASPDILCHIVTALKYALLGKIDPRMTEVAVQVSDDAGNTWVIQRSASKTRCLCNGTQVNIEDAEKSLVDSLFDYEVEKNVETEELSNAKLSMDVFELLKEESNRLIAGYFPLQEDRSRYAAQQIYARVTLLLGEISKSLEEFAHFPKPLNDISITTQLTAKMEKILSKHQGLCQQKKELVDQITHSQDIDISSVKRLAEELRTIRSIDGIYSLVADPTQSPNIIEEELLKIDAELHEITSKNRIKNISLEHPEFLPNWTRILDALSEMQVSKSLLKATLEARKVTSERLAPVVKQCWQVIDTALSNDIKISSELDNCLATLRLKMAALEQVENKDAEALKRKGKNQKSSSVFSNLLDKLSDKVKDISLPPSDQAMILEVRQTYRNNLETARMAAEAINSQVKELRSSSCFIQDDYEKILAGINEANDRFKADHARTLKKWCEIIKEYDLPEDLELKQLLSLLFTYGNVARLVERKKKLKAILNDRKANLVKLEKLVTEWREKTGSQKGSALGNPAILLSEANGILRYRKEREKKLEKMQEVLEKNHAIHEIRRYVEGAIEKTVADWTRIFAEFNAKSVVSIDAVSIEKFKDMLTKVRHVEALVDVTFNNENLAEEFLQEPTARGVLFKLIVWREHSIDNATRLKFLNLMERISTVSAAGIKLFLLADETLGEMLVKMGVGQAKKLPLILSQKQEPLKAPQDLSDSVLSPKAKAMLQVFGGKKRDRRI